MGISKGDPGPPDGAEGAVPWGWAPRTEVRGAPQIAAAAAHGTDSRIGTTRRVVVSATSSGKGIC
jgi:hypothetical protein